MGANVLGLSKCEGYTWRSSSEFAGGGDLEWDAIQKKFDCMQEGIVRDCWVQKNNHFFATNCANWTESMVEWTAHMMCSLYETM